MGRAEDWIEVDRRRRMKKLITTLAIVTAMAVPAFAEGDDASAKQGEPKSSGAKASTDMKQDAGSASRAQGTVIQRSTTGAAPTDEERRKTGITGGKEGGGASEGAGASGGTSGSGDAGSGGAGGGGAGGGGGGSGN
jgi:hypothetical protein